VTTLLDSVLSPENENHVYVIAEAGLNHNGSVEMAKRLVDSAVLAGADCVKFQKRTVDKLAIGPVLDAEDNRFPTFGKTYREVRAHIEFGQKEYSEIMEYCDARRIDFLCTAFDEDAVDFLESLGIAGYKMASHSLTNLPLLRYVAARGKPTVLSTGMCEVDEIDAAADVFKRSGTPFVLLHCVSAYPTPIEQCNLSAMALLRDRYDVPVGYSGHELGYLPTLAAVALGAQVIERHITLDKSLEGFDHRISLEPDELVRMVRDIRSCSTAIGSGEKRISDQEMITRDKYRVSMVSVEEIPAGASLSEEMVTYRNPGTGIAPKLAATVLGKRAARNIPADSLIETSMFE
jgi:sialic acid synthase SpsE